MRNLIQSFVLLLSVLLVPTAADAAYVQLAEGVFQDGSTLYIGSGVTSLGSLRVNPSVIYCYSSIPPSCTANTFTGYDAVLHVPKTGITAYFTALYWYNFNNITADAIEPQLINLSAELLELELGEEHTLSASVSPSNATPTTVAWSTTDASVATVNAGRVTAVGTGECYIRVSCADKQAYCHVVVSSPRVVIVLDKHEVSLLPSHTITLNATCTPATTDLVVTSSNTSVAIPRYTNGTIMVLGIAEGTATITVSTTDGWCVPGICEVTVYTELGDVNGDGFVDIDDVTTLINVVLGNETEGVHITNADVNRDGSIGIDDVTIILTYILNGYWPFNYPSNQEYIVNGVSFKMVEMTAGKFTMGVADTGSNNGNQDNAKPSHEVTLSSYWIGETEVTQELWHAVMGDNPSEFTGNLNYPVETVSWNDCQEFILRLNEITGEQFRLPTEAEWEYAARGGENSKGYDYSGSNNVGKVAWFNGNSDNVTHPVRRKTPNELGLYDMSGNVWEWCQDWYGHYSSSPVTNPLGPASGNERICRGGSWYSSDLFNRVTCRYSCVPSNAQNNIGLRLALSSNDSARIRLSKTVVALDLGESVSVDILNGSGSYSVASSSDIVISNINGEELLVAGIGMGTATICVTDNVTKAKTFLNVIVANLSGETKGEWAYTSNGMPAVVGQSVKDHLFVRMSYDNEAYDNAVYFSDTQPQQVWFWLDDNEIYNNAEVQALTPISCDMDGNVMYNEITYNSLQLDLYLPEGFELVSGQNMFGRNAMFDWGPRMPYESSISTYNKGTIVIDSITYNYYRVVLINNYWYGSHLSANDEIAYVETGALKKDDGAVFALFIKNINPEQGAGGQVDMIIANQEFGIYEGFNEGWDANDIRFFYGFGGNNTSQRFQKYHRVKIHY